jgi:putative copper export protein
MPRTSIFIVLAIVAFLLALAVVLGTFMPPQFLGGFNQPLAVPLMAFVPVLLVAVWVGCVLVYRWVIQAFGRRERRRKRCHYRKARKL